MGRVCGPRPTTPGSRRTRIAGAGLLVGAANASLRNGSSIRKVSLPRGARSSALEGHRRLRHRPQLRLSTSPTVRHPLPHARSRASRRGGGAGTAATGRCSSPQGRRSRAPPRASARAATLDLEEVAVEAGADDHVGRPRRARAPPLRSPREPRTSIVRRHHPDSSRSRRTASARYGGCDRGLERFGERQRPVGNVVLGEQRPVGKRHEARLVPLQFGPPGGDRVPLPLPVDAVERDLAEWQRLAERVRRRARKPWARPWRSPLAATARLVARRSSPASSASSRTSGSRPEGLRSARGSRWGSISPYPPSRRR